MKGHTMNKFKKSLMASVMAGMLMTSAPGTAGSWLGAAASAGGTLYTAAMLFFNGGDVVHMPILGNIDAIQIALEGGVLAQMFFVKDKWDPEPSDTYQKAAEDNGSGGGSGGSGGGGVSVENLSQKLAFVAASLKNVGIEAIEVGPSLGEIATVETRTKIFEELEYLQPKGSKESDSDASESKNKIPGAGDCDASYSFCLKKMTENEMDEVAGRQQQNEQNFGTAGITHAELGLKAVQQAIVNDGGSAMNKEATSASSEKVRAAVAAGKKVSAQNLAGLIGTGANTVGAMKIVSLMNLELAQRLNQGNMLQGATLTVEAARALSDTAGITD